MSLAELNDAIPDDVAATVHRILERACERNLSIVTAESCTGGLLASLLTDVEGASSAFERGFVVYSNEAKCDLLAVGRRMIDECGAVSAQTARAMAAGALDRSRGDIAVAITGFAGAGGPEDEPGLVYFASARRGGPIHAREKHFGDIGRGPTRIACLRTALAMIDREME